MKKFIFLIFYTLFLVKASEASKPSHQIILRVLIFTEILILVIIKLLVIHFVNEIIQLENRIRILLIHHVQSIFFSIIEIIVLFMNLRM